MLTNTRDGKSFYEHGDPDSLTWFHEQWKVWPFRANPELTINLSFHYGGILAYREINNEEPEMSEDLAECIKFLDRKS